MEQTEQQAFDEVQAEKAALGIPNEPEPAEPEPAPPEPTKVEPTPKETPATEKPEEPPTARTEPVNRFKAYKEKLRSELQADYDKKLEQLKQDLASPKNDDLEAEVKKLSDELGLDLEKTKRFIEVARKGIPTELSADDKKLLEETKAFRDTLAQTKEEKEQEAIFESEWTEEALPSLKTQYPNASAEQLEKAKTALEALAFSEKYHENDMDYILFKEKESLQKILFSPNAPSFESARPAPFELGDEFPEFKENMTPAEFLAFERKREALLDSYGGKKVRVTSQDDSGNFTEREE